MNNDTSDGGARLIQKAHLYSLILHCRIRTARDASDRALAQSTAAGMRFLPLCEKKQTKC
jgi:hypothetical protein